MAQTVGPYGPGAFMHVREINDENDLKVALAYLGYMAGDARLIQEVIARDGLQYLDGNLWLFKKQIKTLEEIAKRHKER